MPLCFGSVVALRGFSFFTFRQVGFFFGTMQGTQRTLEHSGGLVKTLTLMPIVMIGLAYIQPMTLFETALLNDVDCIAEAIDSDDRQALGGRLRGIGLRNNRSRKSKLSGLL